MLKEPNATKPGLPEPPSLDGDWMVTGDGSCINHPNWVVLGSFGDFSRVFTVNAYPESRSLVAQVHGSSSSASHSYPSRAALKPPYVSQPPSSEDVSSLTPTPYGTGNTWDSSSALRRSPCHEVSSEQQWDNPWDSTKTTQETLGNLNTTPGEPQGLSG